MSRRKRVRMNAVRHWNTTRPLGHNTCFHRDSSLTIVRNHFQTCSCDYKNAKQAVWMVGRVLIPMSDSIASLRFLLGEIFDSDHFRTLRSTKSFRLSALTDNLHCLEPGIAFFSIAGHFQTQLCVRAALNVLQAVSIVADTRTFLVTLNTSKK